MAVKLIQRKKSNPWTIPKDLARLLTGTRRPSVQTGSWSSQDKAKARLKLQLREREGERDEYKRRALIRAQINTSFSMCTAQAPFWVPPPSNVSRLFLSKNLA